MWVDGAEKRLAAAGIKSPRLEAQLLAAHVIGCDRGWILTHPVDPLPELAAECLLQRRESHEPLAYILGVREFYGRPFHVRPGVLIPRQETETLIEHSLAAIPEWATVLDFGTGSGCIGLTLKAERPNWHVTLSDVSVAALAVAEENARRHRLEVQFVHNDGLCGMRGPYDLIISNPPYVAQNDLLPRDVAEHEPPEALFGGLDGLDFYRRIAIESKEALQRRGWVIVEAGDRQAPSIRSVFASAGWKHQSSHYDLLGFERSIAFSLS